MTHSTRLLPGIIKTVFILLLSTCSTINLDAQSGNNNEAIKRIINCPKGKDKDILVTLNIFPKNIQNFEKGYQRLVEIIPEGFTAKANPSSTATIDIKGNKLRFYWMNGSMPNEGIITVSYSLHKTSTEKIKNVEIVGSFKYSVNNENKEVEISGDNSCSLK